MTHTPPWAECAGTVRVLMEQVGDLDEPYQMRDCGDSTAASYKKSSKQIFQKKKKSPFQGMSCPKWQSTFIRWFLDYQRADIQFAILVFFLSALVKAAAVGTDLKKLFLFAPEGCSNGTPIPCSDPSTSSTSCWQSSILCLQHHKLAACPWLLGLSVCGGDGSADKLCCSALTVFVSF